MNILPVNQAQNALNTIINPQQPASNSQSTSATQATDQVSISAAAQALANSEVNESPSIEALETPSTQLLEGESTSDKSIDVTA